MARRRHRAVLDAALPQRPGLLGAVVPGRLHHRELPRPVPQLVLLAAGDEHGAARASRRSRRSSATRRCSREDGRPMHKSAGNAIEFDEAAERMGVDVMRWMFAKAAARGQHPLRLARRRRGAPRAARAVEHLRVLRHLRPAGGLDARPRRRRPVAERPAPRPLDPVARGGTAADGRGAARATSMPSARPGRCRPIIDELSTWYLRLSRAGFARTATRPTGMPRSRRSTRRWSRCARMLAPILPFLAEAMYGNLVRPSRPTRPTAST